MNAALQLKLDWAGLRAALQTRALWFFFAVWLLSNALLLARGLLEPLGVVYGLSVFALTAATVLITRPAPPGAAAPPAAERRRLWLQVAFILLIVALTAVRGLVFHNVVYWRVPLWTDLFDTVEAAAVTYGVPNPNYLSNPLAYFVIPLAGLLLLGARWRTLGFEPGRSVGRVLLLWCALPLLIMAYLVLGGQVALLRAGQAVVSNSLQNGFFEEFLMRGALQTRLARLLPPAWALVITALIFGAWHLGLGFANTGGDSLLAALASTLANQAALGLAFGAIFVRTGNLLAPSVVHVMLNVVGAFLG